jgi:hypothetical protein
VHRTPRTGSGLTVSGIGGVWIGGFK